MAIRPSRIKNGYVVKQKHVIISQKEKIRKLKDRENVLKSLISSMDCTIENADKDIKQAEKEVALAQEHLSKLKIKIASAPKRKMIFEAELRQVATKKKKLTNPDIAKLKKLMDKVEKLKSEIKEAEKR